jgi:DNA replication and repair protein RecF
MKFEWVRLRNFRNHEATDIGCAPERNVFLGNNGEGKTNILEAISYLCLTKSFYASSDATAVQLGEPGFVVSGKAVSDIDTAHTVEVRYTAETKEKTISINNDAVQERSSVIGMFPVVVLSPENGNVTSGTPADRRRFIDVVISQSSKSYLQDLMEYRRILRQRNRVLFDAKMAQYLSSGILEPWNENLIKRGSLISQKRALFVEEFSPFLVDAYGKIAGSAETPSIEYNSSVTANGVLPVNEVENLYRKELLRQEQEERKLGTSLVGPHKDELVFEINKRGLKAFASQGQHKTFLVALKIAEFFYLRDRCKETPVLLLDDVFSELDEARSEKLLALTANLGQTFITATDERRFMKQRTRKGELARFHVRQGRVASAKSTVLAN